ncbi:MAG: hypothetical protein AAF468_01110 [Pseudomonadota bacterium]
MQKLSLACLSMSVFAALSVSVPSFANDKAVTEAACACELQVPAANAVGSIIKINGDVFLSGSKGPEKASEGAALTVGSWIMTGSKSSAKVAVGKSCQLTLAANSDLNIESAENGKICVKLESEVSFKSREARFGQANPPPPPPPPLGPLAIVGAGAAGAAAAGTSGAFGRVGTTLPAVSE